MKLLREETDAAADIRGAEASASGERSAFVRRLQEEDLCPSSPFCDLGFLQVIDLKRFVRLSPAHLALHFTHFVRLASG
ncbi:MAG: hypothetical protein OXH99_17050, partial [Bryobacterales bacterium]|nr:hypothetical protein [Bryobacterales bacterium]